VLAGLASGDSGAASDSSNVVSTGGSIVGEQIVSTAGPAEAEKCAALDATIGGEIAGNGK
jgi:hypothetical protein